MRKEWDYVEIAKLGDTRYYSAATYPEPDGRWFFRAFPRRGDWCTEGYFDTAEDAAQAGDDWFSGRETALTKKMYSASY